MKILGKLWIWSSIMWLRRYSVWSQLWCHCWNTNFPIIPVTCFFKFSQQRNQNDLENLVEKIYWIRLCVQFQVSLWLENTIGLLIMCCYSDYWFNHLLPIFLVYTNSYIWNVYICNGIHVGCRTKFESNKWKTGQSKYYWWDHPIKTGQNWNTVLRHFSISSRSKGVSTLPMRDFSQLISNFHNIFSSFIGLQIDFLDCVVDYWPHFWHLQLWQIAAYS